MNCFEPSDRGWNWWLEMCEPEEGRLVLIRILPLDIFKQLRICCRHHCNSNQQKRHVGDNLNTSVRMRVSRSKNTRPERQLWWYLGQRNVNYSVPLLVCAGVLLVSVFCRLYHRPALFFWELWKVGQACLASLMLPAVLRVRLPSVAVPRVTRSFTYCWKIWKMDSSQLNTWI